jgi:6,7-dimethyl-8-ribityllumazine synthase
MKEIRGKMVASKRQFVIIVSRWNELITKELTEGALEELKRHGAKKTVVIHVSGTWEIPPVAKKLLASKKKPDGIIALGCIMQGQTPHAKLLGSDVGGALMGLQTKYSTPITWGILTPDTQEQALDRAGLKMGNKGREAALAAIELADVLSQIE